MSNQLKIQYMEFKHLDNDGKCIDNGFGYIINDSFDMDYVDIFDSFKELKETIKPSTLSNILKRSCKFELEIPLNYKSICFNGVVYLNEEIQKIIEQKPGEF